CRRGRGRWRFSWIGRHLSWLRKRPPSRISQVNIAARQPIHPRQYKWTRQGIENVFELAQTRHTHNHLVDTALFHHETEACRQLRYLMLNQEIRISGKRIREASKIVGQVYRVG